MPRALDRKKSSGGWSRPGPPRVTTPTCRWSSSRISGRSSRCAGRLESKRRVQDRIADAITAFSGSMPFIYLHVAMPASGSWTTSAGSAWRIFDPYPFGLLTMVVSLEAIFLATFVLLSQNRQAEAVEQRADLDLQINLLAEHEITRILTLVDAIADHSGWKRARTPSSRSSSRTSRRTRSSRRWTTARRNCTSTRTSSRNSAPSCEIGLTLVRNPAGDVPSTPTDCLPGEVLRDIALGAITGGRSSPPPPGGRTAA